MALGLGVKDNEERRNRHFPSVKTGKGRKRGCLLLSGLRCYYWVIYGGVCRLVVHFRSRLLTSLNRPSPPSIVQRLTATTFQYCSSRWLMESWKEQI
jgi:hypothetical protein